MVKKVIQKAAYLCEYLEFSAAASHNVLPDFLNGHLQKLRGLDCDDLAVSSVAFGDHFVSAIWRSLIDGFIEVAWQHFKLAYC